MRLRASVSPEELPPFDTFPWDNPSLLLICWWYFFPASLICSTWRCRFFCFSPPHKQQEHCGDSGVVLFFSRLARIGNARLLRFSFRLIVFVTVYSRGRNYSLEFRESCWLFSFIFASYVNITLTFSHISSFLTCRNINQNMREARAVKCQKLFSRGKFTSSPIINSFLPSLAFM